MSEEEHTPSTRHKGLQAHNDSAEPRIRVGVFLTSTSDTSDQADFAHTRRKENENTNVHEERNVDENESEA